MYTHVPQHFEMQMLLSWLKSPGFDLVLGGGWSSLEEQNSDIGQNTLKDYGFVCIDVQPHGTKGFLCRDPKSGGAKRQRRSVPRVPNALSFFF